MRLERQHQAPSGSLAQASSVAAISVG